MQGWTALSLARRVVQTLPANLRRERMVRGLTQEQLAELANLNPRTVQKRDTGFPAHARLGTGCRFDRLKAPSLPRGKACVTLAAIGGLLPM